jgi:hypothetical protein
MAPRANWKGYLRLSAGVLSYCSLPRLVTQRRDCGMLD